MKGSLLAMLGLMTAFGFIACGDNDDELVDEVTVRVNCFQICETYDDCVTDIDVTACTDQCEEMTDVPGDNLDAADACEECLDDRTCQEIEDAGCFDNCPVVPAED